MYFYEKIGKQKNNKMHILTENPIFSQNKIYSSSNKMTNNND